MPDYKCRKIKLAPRKRANGTWQCPYTIIEFRPTCWAYHKGCPDGSFASRQEAATTALEEAKRIVDSLESPPEVARFGPGAVLGAYGNRTRRLVFSTGQHLGWLFNLVRNALAFPTYRKLFDTINVFAWSRR